MVPLGVVIGRKIPSNAAKTKRRRYYLSFRTKLQENGHQRGENLQAYLLHLQGMGGGSIQLNMGVFEASGNIVQVNVFTVPFTHGHMKSAYSLFVLLGCSVPRLQHYLTRFPTALIPDTILSEETTEGVTEPVAPEFLHLLSSSAVLPASDDLEASDVPPAVGENVGHVQSQKCCLIS